MTSARVAALGPPVKALMLALLLFATAACGAYRFPVGGTGEAGFGTVTGQVKVVPCAPVEAAPKTCLARPVGELEIDFNGPGGTASTRTDARGSYSIELPAGTWKVSFRGYARIISGPPVVTVNAGATVVANYVVDSGIRYPVGKEPSTNPHPPEGMPPAA